MVALNPAYAPCKSTDTVNVARQRVDGAPKGCPKGGLKRVPGIGRFEPQNRVGDFFCESGESVGTDRLSGHWPRLENELSFTITASGRPCFINADPIGFAGGMNWYAYAGNNPIMYVDPSGHVRWLAAGRAALGMVANGIGAVIGVGVAAIPEPSMVTVAAGGALALKSGYGFGANWQNFTMALADADPVSTGALANDVAQIVAPGNQNAQTAATILDLGTDLATGQIIARGAASMVGKSPQAFPSLTIGSVRNPTNLGTGATLFQGGCPIRC